jgi:hypothetical protein
MSEISKQALFSAILSSHILDPYLEQNADLAELIKSLEHPDIHYFDSSAPAKEIAPTLKRRLAVMVARNISHNLEATQQLVTFAEEHPDSPVYNVTFNCKAQHYGVRCGVIDDQIRVICVMTGGRIPDELLGEAAT